MTNGAFCVYFMIEHTDITEKARERVREGLQITVKVENLVGFYCQECVEYWECDLTQSGAELVWDEESGHYWSKCSECGNVRHNVHRRMKGIVASAKIPNKKLNRGPDWYDNMIRGTAGKHTGPKTPEGKARVSLNAYKHGGKSKNFHLLAPAKYGAFPVCESCPEDVAAKCKAKKISYCPMNMGPMLKFMSAWQNGDVKELRHHASVSQAQVYNQLQMLMQDLLKNGVVVKDVKEWDGGRQEFIKSNPSLDHLPKLMNVLGFTADQQTMTPKSEKDSEAIEGFLASGKPTDSEFVKAMKAQNDKLMGLLQEVAIDKSKNGEG